MLQVSYGAVFIARGIIFSGGRVDSCGGSIQVGPSGTATIHSCAFVNNGQIRVSVTAACTTLHVCDVRSRTKPGLSGLVG